MSKYQPCSCDDTITPTIIIVNSPFECASNHEIAKQAEQLKLVKAEQKWHGPRNRHERRAQAAMIRRGLEWSRP